MDYRFFHYSNFMEEFFPFKIERRNINTITNDFHQHDYIQICYVVKGACVHSIYDQNSTSVKGDIFVIPPFVKHAMSPIECKELELVQVDFMPFFINENMTEFSKMDSFVDFAYIQPMLSLKDSMVPRLNVSTDAQYEIERLLLDMEAEYNSKEEGYNLAIKADLLKFLVIIGREFKNYLKNGKNENIISYHRNLFFKSIDYINENYKEKVTLDDMAKMATMSPSYYSYIFKLIEGNNFIEYLNKIRIHNAIELIKSTDMNISEVCFSVGFNNLGHFNKIFKDVTGVTPTSFRKNIKK